MADCERPSAIFVRHAHVIGSLREFRGPAMSTRQLARPCDGQIRMVLFDVLAVLVLTLPMSAMAGAGEPASREEEGRSPQDTAAKKQVRPKDEKWQSLFDGRSLGKWKVIEEHDFLRHGKVYVRDGRIVLEAGQPGTGVRWTGPFPKIDYEVAFEAMRVEGSDFFCGMTFPVGESALTLVLGGWGGPVVGLSSIDGEPAIENETCLYKQFEQQRWYRVRLRVAKPGIEVWLDEEKVVDLATQDRKLTIYWSMEPALPFGVATWRTTGALRDVRLRPIKPTPAD